MHEGDAPPEVDDVLRGEPLEAGELLMRVGRLLRDQAEPAGPGRGGIRIQRALVIGQIAVSVERKRFEHALARTNSFLQAVIEQALDATN